MDYSASFLKDLNKNFPGFCYYRLHQVIKKVVEGKEVKGSGAMEISESEIQKWNNDKNMNSIFFSPNGSFRGEKGRKKIYAKQINCFVIERDDDEEIKIDFWKDFIYQPSAVVETRRGYQAYWFLKAPVSWEEYGKKWDRIQMFLCNEMYGDHGAKDISRIFRLPGTTYWKEDIQGPQTKCVLYEPDRKYDFNDFAVLVNEEKVVKELLTFKKEYETDSTTSKMLFEEINSTVSVKEVLEDLGSGRWRVVGTSIEEDGKITNGYKYNGSGNYIRNFTEHDSYRPEGPSFAVAKFLLGSAGKAYHYFHTTYGIGEKKTTQITSQVKEDKQITGDDEDVVITTETAVITISIEDKKGYKTTGKGISEIIAGYFRVVGFFKEPDGTHVYIIKYLKQNGDGGYINIKELAGANELVKLLSKVGITFMGTKTDFLSILQYIHSAQKEFKLIDKLGVYSDTIIVNKVGNYIYDDTYYVSCNTLNAKSGQVIDIGAPMGKEKFLEEVKSLGLSYEPKIINSLFIMYGLYFFSKYLRDEFPFLPITILVGLTQSGKSTLRWGMMEMFGVDSCTETQASATEFSVMYMMNNYIPIHFCEFDNSVLKFDFDSFAKNTFDGTSSTRGTADQKLINYGFNAGLVVDGESRSLAPSVYTRSVMLFMNPRYKRVEKKEWNNVTGYFLKNYNNIKNIKEHFKKNVATISKASEHIQSSEKTRIINNYALMLAFADCFGFRSIVEESILQQLNEQFIMKGEDNLDVYIKAMMNFAAINRLPAKFEAGSISIELFFDHMKYDKRRSADLQSNIQTVNHHFGREGIDVVHIPLDYIFKNKNMHPTFNRYMNMLEARNKPDLGMARQAIKAFCDTNNYKEQAYYQSALYH